MSRVGVVSLAVLAAVLMFLGSGTALPATYQVSLPSLVGTYDVNSRNNTRTASFDFGIRFSAIESVGFVGSWSYGGITGMPDSPFLCDYVAYLLSDSGHFPAVARLGDGWPSTFEGDLRQLLSGSGRVQVGVGPPPPPVGYGTWLGEITSISLVVDGTPVVPEPSSLLALGTGILGLTGIIRRRR